VPEGGPAGRAAMDDRVRVGQESAQPLGGH
jgi:hypothetical protein